MWIVSEYCSFQSDRLTDFKLEKHHELRKAVQSRNLRLVQDLIKEGAPVNDILEKVYGVVSYETPLHLAVISRCPEIVKVLLDNGADRHSRNWNEETPLILAAKMQNITLIDLLLSNESSNLEDLNHLSHLHIACMRGNLEVVKVLLSKSKREALDAAVKTSSMYWSQFTPLHFAVLFEQIEVVEYLLNCGSDMTIKDTKELTPLHLAYEQRNEMIIDMLLAAQAYKFTNPTNAQRLSHFHIACARDNVLIVEHFMKSDVDINLKTKDGWSPIHFAIYYECHNVVNLLSKHGVNLKTSGVPKLLKSTYILQRQIMHSIPRARKKESNDTAGRLNTLSDFHNACIKNDADKVERLLSDGVISNQDDLNTPGINGCTPLHIALRCKSQRTASILLDHGADFLLQDNEGKTALHIAFELELTEELDKMISDMDNPTSNLIDNRGLSVFHILCARAESRKIEDFLCSGVDIDIQVGNGSSHWAGFAPIHFAIKYEQFDIVEILLVHGADISITTSSGFDSLEFAFYCMAEDFFLATRRREIVNLILIFGTKWIENFNDHGISPLHVLCLRYDGNPDMLRPLLDSHRDCINKRTELTESYYNGKTPLDFAVMVRNIKQVTSLVENGADLFRTDDHGQMPLERLFCVGFEPTDDTIMMDEEDLFTFVIATMEKFRPSYFFGTCISGLFNIVKRFIHKISDSKMIADLVNYRKDGGETPLHALLLQNIEEVAPRRETVKLLLEHGADVNTRNFMLQTPLHDVKKGIDLDVTRLLLDHGADVNAQNIFCETPLVKWYSEYFHYYDLRVPDKEYFKKQIILLLENGCDINIVDEQNRTCLEIVESHLIFWNGEDDQEPPLRYELARILLEHVKKLQIIGFYVSQSNEKAYSKVQWRGPTYEENIFVKQCEEELQSMMDVKIDSRTSLHDILFRSPDEMAFYCENVILCPIVESEDFSRRFPLYSFLIKLQIKNGRARRYLLETSAKHFPYPANKPLPKECLEKILRHLTDADLKNVISSKTVLNAH
ncbi:hypothetical protein QAD02_001039 [Eretmocerus hayati]|uniref:Uncharacterized protein n=1 Tax=Eretmocerus hayati TaxID=131215 RepID=A0ACC2NJR3_9HYME|nr:hypothetical protein QAD02_001039 [Eretmocerus hayati]